MPALQIALYCLLFFLLVKCAVKDSGRNCLYFYPKACLDEAQRRGIANREAEMKKGRRFMAFFCIVMLLALLAIVALWNRVSDFGTACLQTCLFLVVMNWFDGIVIDRLWVGQSRIWRVEGMEGVPYVKPWREVLVRRGLGTAICLLLALPIAGIALLIGKIAS